MRGKAALVLALAAPVGTVAAVLASAAVPAGSGSPTTTAPALPAATGADVAALETRLDDAPRADRFVVYGGALPGDVHDALPAGPTPLDLSSLALPRQGQPLAPHEFYFTRAVYSSGGRGIRGFGRRGWGGGSWATDYPKADRQFLTVLLRLVDMDGYPDQNAVPLDDPELRRFPFIYALEVGRMGLSEEEVEGLRGYLEAGGFLVIDDFWGVREWQNFELEMARVFPDRIIEDIPPDHPIFRMVYPIDGENIVQVPNIDRGISHERYGTPTWEDPSYTRPHVRGIFHEDGRLLVVINYNTDLGDAWEWAENPYYPLKFSTFAFEMGVNMIVYAMAY